MRRASVQDAKKQPKVASEILLEFIGIDLVGWLWI
jgi:hypothetical protein